MCLCVIYTLSQKNIPDIIDYNVKTNCQILTIFSLNIPDTTCHQTIISFPTSPNVCYCTTCGNHSQRNITFYTMRYYCLINIMRKNTFYSHFGHFG